MKKTISYSFLLLLNGCATFKTDEIFNLRLSGNSQIKSIECKPKTAELCFEDSNNIVSIYNRNTWEKTILIGVIIPFIPVTGLGLNPTDFHLEITIQAKESLLDAELDFSELKFFDPNGKINVFNYGATEYLNSKGQLESFNNHFPERENILNQTDKISRRVYQINGKIGGKDVSSDQDLFVVSGIKIRNKKRITLVPDFTVHYQRKFGYRLYQKIQ